MLLNLNLPLQGEEIKERSCCCLVTVRRFMGAETVLSWFALFSFLAAFDILASPLIPMALTRSLTVCLLSEEPPLPQPFRQEERGIQPFRLGHWSLTVPSSALWSETRVLILSKVTKSTDMYSTVGCRRREKTCLHP